MTTTSEDGLEGLKTDTNLTDDLSAAPPLLRFCHVHVRPHGGGPQLHSQCIRPRDHHHDPARSRLTARGGLEPGRLLVPDRDSPPVRGHDADRHHPALARAVGRLPRRGIDVGDLATPCRARGGARRGRPQPRLARSGVVRVDRHVVEPLRNVRVLSAYFLSPQRRWLIRHGGSPGSRSGSQGGWSSGSCGCRRLCCSWPRR